MALEMWSRSPLNLRAIEICIELFGWPHPIVPLARPKTSWQTSVLSLATTLLFLVASAILSPLESGARLAKTLLTTGVSRTSLPCVIRCRPSTLSSAPATRVSCLARLCKSARNLVALGCILGRLVENSLNRVRTSVSGACSLRVVPLANRCRVEKVPPSCLSTRPNEWSSRWNLETALLLTSTLVRPPSRIRLIREAKSCRGPRVCLSMKQVRTLSSSAIVVATH